MFVFSVSFPASDPITVDTTFMAAFLRRLPLMQSFSVEVNVVASIVVAVVVVFAVVVIVVVVVVTVVVVVVVSRACGRLRCHPRWG